jgi:hypothetical protein
MATVLGQGGQSSRLEPPPKVEIGAVAPVLILFISLVLSFLLWGLSEKSSSMGKWPFILFSELLAATAGISLGWIFVGGIGGTQRTADDSSLKGSKGAGAGPQKAEQKDVPKFGLGSAFFVARAKPLKDQVDALTEQAAAAKSLATPAVQSAVTRAAFDEKVLEPEYAIGQGLISRDEYNDFRNTYLAQSELSLGLIFPLLLIIFAIAINSEDVWSKLWVPAFIVAGTFFMFVIAMERRQKYRIELKLLLVSRWDKQAAADKAAKDAKAKANDKSQEDAIRKILKDELKGLHLEVKPLVVEVRKNPEESPQTKPGQQKKPEEGVF